MQKLSVLFIMNGIGSIDGLSGISGGDIRWIEIAKWWTKQGYEIHVISPEAGITLCKKFGLKAIFHEFIIPNDYSLKSHLLRFFKSRSIPKFASDFEGVIYSTTENAYDVFPALKVKEKGKKVTWVVIVHWVAPLRRKGTNLFNSFLFFLNQRIGFHYIRNKADIVLAVSENTADQAKKIGLKNVFAVTAGVDFERIRKIAVKSAALMSADKYDAIFMKRLSGTKGVFDIIDIWNDVVKCKKNAKLGMIGLGSKDTMTKLVGMVENYGLKNNVDFLGPIYNFERKFSILSASSLFVLPSYEENWAIVIGEALAAGVPVLCYDLPEIRPIWKDTIEWVPKGDKKKFAIKIIDLLNHDQRRSELSRCGILFIKKHDWRTIAEKEMKLIMCLPKPQNHSK